MTWRDVLRRDLRSAYRARTIPGVFLTILLMTAGIVALQLYLDPRPPPPSTDAAVQRLGMILSLVIPIVGLWGAYGAIVVERTSGSVRFLMGLPNSRLDAYGGKYLSRAAVVTGSIAIGAVLAGLIVALGYASGSFARIAHLGGLSLLYGIVFVGCGLVISTLFDTESRASSAMIGLFMLLRFGWPVLQYAGLRLAKVEPGLEPYPAWYFVLGRINPMNAYVKLVDGVAGPDAPLSLITHPEGTETIATTSAFALVVLLAWATVVPLLGYRRFRNADLL